MYTPFLHSLKKGGNIFVFPSASRDISRAFGSTEYHLSFTHIACLNLPENFLTSNSSVEGDTVKSENINRPDFSTSDADYNKIVSEDFQNYVLNTDAMFVESRFDNRPKASVLKTNAESIMWGYFKQLGLLDFKEIADTNIDKYVTKTSQDEKRGYLLVESTSEQASPVTNNVDFEDNRLVKYVGSIDMTNNVDLDNDSYTEIYCYIPSNVGSTKTILWDVDLDKRDKKTLKEHEVIYGQRDQLDNVSVNGVIDHETCVNKKTHLSCVPYFYEDGDNKKKVNYEGVIGIDFDTNDYEEIVSSPEVEHNFMAFNGLGNNFEFNAIAIYYTISDGVSSSVNLFGLLFVDNIKTNGESHMIPTSPKYKFDDITGGNGNAWGMKVNLRIDASSNDMKIETIVNEYNSFSMHLFTEALAKLQATISMFEDTNTDLLALRKDVDDLIAALRSTVTLDNLNKRLSDLERKVNNYSIATEDSDSIVNLITNVMDNLKDILNGETPLEVQFNTDVLKAGDGIKIDKDDVDKKVTITNKNQMYNIPFSYNKYSGKNVMGLASDYNYSKAEIVYDLNKFSNYFVCEAIDYGNRNIPVYFVLKSSGDITWQKGQNARIVITEGIKFNANPKIVIRNSSGVDVCSYTISLTEIQCKKPIINVVCIEYDEKNIVYDFNVEVINPFFDSNISNGVVDETGSIVTLADFSELVENINSALLVPGTTYKFHHKYWKYHKPLDREYYSIDEKGECETDYEWDIYLLALEESKISNKGVGICNGKCFSLEWTSDTDTRNPNQNFMITWLKDSDNNFEADYDFVNVKWKSYKSNMRKMGDSKLKIYPYKFVNDSGDTSKTITKDGVGVLYYFQYFSWVNKEDMVEVDEEIGTFGTRNYFDVMNKMSDVKITNSMYVVLYDAKFVSINNCRFVTFDDVLQSNFNVVTCSFVQRTNHSTVDIMYNSMIFDCNNVVVNNTDSSFFNNLQFSSINTVKHVFLDRVYFNRITKPSDKSYELVKLVIGGEYSSVCYDDIRVYGNNYDVVLYGDDYKRMLSKLSTTDSNTYNIEFCGFRYSDGSTNRNNVRGAYKLTYGGRNITTTPVESLDDTYFDNHDFEQWSIKGWCR